MNPYGYSWEGIRQVRVTLLGARHVPERLCGGALYQVLYLYLYLYLYGRWCHYLTDRRNICASVRRLYVQAFC